MGTYLLALLLLQAPGARPAAPPGLSWNEADALAARLGDLEARYKKGERPKKGMRPVGVGQSELNSYLNLTLGPKLPKGVTGVNFRLDRDRLEGRGTVDLAQVGKDVKLDGSVSALAFFGAVPLEFVGTLRSENGFGTFVLETVRLGSFPVPPSVVADLIRRNTKGADYPDGFDLLAPFRLPYSVSRVRLEPGRAVLEF
ncbi:MAG: hypothetical protein NDJ94_14195 [Vicinamibacteria bacterium]|nr:hypothetical protein [Vicinamibacteria bacterium]